MAIGLPLRKYIEYEKEQTKERKRGTVENEYKFVVCIITNTMCISASGHCQKCSIARKNGFPRLSVRRN